MMNSLSFCEALLWPGLSMRVARLCNFERSAYRCQNFVQRLTVCNIGTQRHSKLFYLHKFSTDENLPTDKQIPQLMKVYRPI